METMIKNLIGGEFWTEDAGKSIKVGVINNQDPFLVGVALGQATVKLQKAGFKVRSKHAGVFSQLAVRGS